MIGAFPKIFALGNRCIAEILQDPVEVTEKVDGSQFCFGRRDGILFIRSKRAQLFPENADKMFRAGIEYICSIQERLPNNMTFYCEYLNKPKHNVLVYDRIPKNHLMLFGVRDNNGFQRDNDVLVKMAELLGIEAVPCLLKGHQFSEKDIIGELEKLLDQESVLGGQKIEGVVLKNYEKSVMMGTNLISDGIMCAKFVSERFKEKHQKEWKGSTSKSIIVRLVEKYKSEARWRKAIQHLKEDGVLEFDPRDIGKLIKEIQTDLVAEEKEEIKEDLWRLFNGNFIRTAVAGFPEWYKKFLVERAYTKDD